jgi:TPR repeat protein
MYLDGRGTVKDVPQGVKWLDAAALQKYELARNALVFIYAEGFGVKPDAVEAVYRFGRQRLTDEGEAAYHLGNFYARGFSVWLGEQILLDWVYAHRGISPEQVRPYLHQLQGRRWSDEDEALRWYTLGAEKGFVGAQVNLATLLMDADSAQWHCGEAVKWLHKAADQGDQTALVNMGLLWLDGPKERVMNGIGVQLQKVGQGMEILDVVSSGAAQEAGLKVGDVIVALDGQRTQSLEVSDVTARLRAERKAPHEIQVRRVPAGELPAIAVQSRVLRLSCPGAERMGLRKDPATAFTWFEKAAAKGSPAGRFFMAQAYARGLGVQADARKALSLFERGAGDGDWASAQELSRMYARGEGVAKDPERSQYWLRQAIDLKHRALAH